MAQLVSAAHILDELKRDITRTQPPDPLQYCANWCNQKLEEQRSANMGERSTAHPVVSGQNYTFGGTIPAPRPPPHQGATPDAFAGGFWHGNVGKPAASAGFGTTSSGPSGSTMFPLGHPGLSSIGIPSSYNLARRTSVSAESLDPSKFDEEMGKVERIPKDASQIERIERAISENFLFRNLDQEQHDDVLSVMKELRVEKNTDVITQGAIGDFFYVVEEGTFEVWVTPPVNHTYDANTRTTTANPQEPPTKVATIEAGGSFGELALMYNAPRAATVSATSDAVLWSIDRITFRSILMAHTVRKRRMYEDLLKDVPLLQSLHPHERAKVADSLESKVFDPDEDIVREGEVGKDFYIIEFGHATVLQRDPETSNEKVVNTLCKGDYFGEIALMNSTKQRQATVRAVSKLGVASLGEQAFTRLLGPLKDILKRNAGAYGNISNNVFAPATSPQSSESTNMPPSSNLRSVSPTGTLTTE